MPQSYAGLWEAYSRFEAPRVSLRLAGMELIPTENWELFSLCLALSSGPDAGALTVELHSESGSAPPACAQLGASTICSLGYAAKATPLFLGYVCRLSFRREHERSVLTLEALDAKGLMMQGSRMELSAPRKLSQALRLTLNGHRYAPFLSTVNIGPVPPALDTPTLFGLESDYDFLCRHARLLHFEFFIVNGMLWYGAPRRGAADVVLDAANDCFSFEWTASLAHRTALVTAVGSDVFGKCVSGQARNPALKRLGGTPPAALLGDELLVRCADAPEPAALRALAEAHMERLEAGACRCRGETVLLPELVPGKTLCVEHVCGGETATFRLTDTEHRIDAQGASMRFEGCQID